MAVQEITVASLKLRNEGKTYSKTLLTDATNGCNFDMNMEDNKCVILLENVNTSAENVTIKGGNSYAGVADNIISIPASSSIFVTLDSSYYKNVSGIDKGKVIIIPATASKIKIAVLGLPI